MTRPRDARAFAFSARQKIEREMKNLALFKRPRAVALYHYGTAMDIEAIRALVSPAPDAQASNMAHRRVVESSAHAVPAILQTCPPGNDPGTDIRDDVLKEALELFEFCYNYEQVRFCFRLADAGLFRFFVARRNPRVTFAYSEMSADEAETGMRARELEIIFKGQRLSRDPKAEADALEALRIHITASVIFEDGKCTYPCGEEESAYLRDLGEELAKTVPLEMPNAINLDGISFGDLRRYWGALLAITNLHFMAHNLASQGNPSKWPLNTTLFSRSSQTLVDTICRVTELPSLTVQKITEWYQYDLSVSGTNRVLQPLLPLSEETICLPYLLVNGANLERNFFKLMHRDPRIRRFAPQIEAQKEPVVLSELSQLFPNDRFRTNTRIQIPNVTDADLAIYELATGFALLVQHKWLIDPDTVEESWTNDQKLVEGVNQGIRCRDAFRTDPTILRSALQLDPREIIRQIEAVTVCRGLETTGFRAATAIPVVNEVSFKGLLKESENLRKFWANLNSRPDRRRAKSDVEDVKWEIKFCGYTFVAPALCY